MKFKTFAKKLSINKETVVTLNVEEMHQVYGGESPSLYDKTCQLVCPTNNKPVDATILC